MEIIAARLIPECRLFADEGMVCVGTSFAVMVTDICGRDTDGTVSRVENCVVF